MVLAVGARQVIVPAGGLALAAKRHLEVVFDEAQVVFDTFRVRGLDAVERRRLVECQGLFRVAVGVGRERVQGQRVGDRQLGVVAEAEVLRLGQAGAVVGVALAGVAGTVGVRRRIGTVRDVLFLHVQGEVDETVVGQGQADIAGLTHGFAIAVFIVLAVGGGQAAAVVGLLEHDVDHAADGVRPVLRRGAVTQDFDVIHQGGGDHVQVHRLRAGVEGGGVVQQRAVVAALAVDQHQHLVAVQAAQADGAHDRGRTEARRGRLVEGRQHLAQGTGQVALAGGEQLLGRNHVYRRRAVGQGAGLATVADDHDGVQGVVAGRGVGGEGQAAVADGLAHGEEQQGMGESLAGLAAACGA
eukprot:gene17241-biopygen9054